MLYHLDRLQYLSKKIQLEFIDRELFFIELFNCILESILLLNIVSIIFNHLTIQILHFILLLAIYMHEY